MGEKLKKFILDLSQSFIDLLTDEKNSEKYAILVHKLLDVLTSSDNEIKYNKILQGFIDTLMSNSNVEVLKMRLHQLTTTGAINAPKAGVLDKEINEIITNSNLPNKPLPEWVAPK